MELLGDRGAADDAAPFQDFDAEPGHSEIGRAGEAVMAAADDDDVVLHQPGQALVWWFRSSLQFPRRVRQANF
jgi:hypothetical protein